jgi:hydrogenase maturation protein HypF
VVGAGTLLLDARPVVRAAADDVAGGATAGQVAARLHAAVARATATACERLARRHGLDTVALAGGVFQNRLLLDDTEHRLSDAGLRVLVPRRLPPNDGAISYGQAAVAAARVGG